MVAQAKKKWKTIAETILLQSTSTGKHTRKKYRNKGEDLIEVLLKWYVPNVALWHKELRV